MKRVDEIMHELGFNKNAEFSVKKAFIKNLIKQAYGVNVRDGESFRSSEIVVALPAQSNDGTNTNTNTNTTEPNEVPQSQTPAPQTGTKPAVRSSMEGTRSDFLSKQLEFNFFEAI